MNILVLIALALLVLLFFQSKTFQYQIYRGDNTKTRK